MAASVAVADDADVQEQTAFTAAVDRVAPSVLRIETVGGLEKVGQLLLGAGPTTGLAVDPAGYIVSSAFNFINKPASILVRLPDGLSLMTAVAIPAPALCTGWSRQSRERGGHLCPPFGDPEGLCSGHDSLYGEHTSHRFRSATEEHRKAGRRSRRDLVHELPLLRLSAGPMPLGSAGPS
jgi:hypothetical protein